MKNAIVLCSGGIDSVTTANYVKKKLKYDSIIILFFDYGQKSIFMERKFSKKCAENLSSKFIEVNVEFLGKISTSLINKGGKIKKLSRKDLKNTKDESEKFYVPCRNAVFLVYALAIAESIFTRKKKKYDIFVGFKQEGKESYPDTTKKFVNSMNNLSSVSCASDFKIIAPLIEMDKEDIIELGTKLGVSFKDTSSCYIGEKIHCGYCLACKLRQEGFYWANMKDPTKYKSS
ncbi:7-cyano-7-deazaguanine synthase [Candidatus Pacearchaeota archaeon]|nr:7-cyano-7-deazaguanine synthase [Candidatus Pacearchaeota archaeon]